MKIPKQLVITALDTIIADAEKAQKEWDKAVPAWRAEREATWKRDHWPQWNKLRSLLSAKVAAKGPITREQLLAIFPNRRGYSDPDLQTFVPDAEPGQSITVKGKTLKRPIEVAHLRSLRSLLTSIEGVSVTDTELTRLGFKDVAAVFQRAGEIGSLS